MSVSAERLDAARVLMRVEAGAFASRILSTGPGAGVRARVLGVLRWLRLLDAALEPFLKMGMKRLDPELRAALRLGLAESFVLGVPAPVATSQAVQLVRRLGKASAAGLANAVLRRAQQRLPELAVDAPPALRLSHPDWLWRRWCEQVGEAAAEKGMAAAQEPAPTWAWFFDDAKRRQIVRAGLELRQHAWCPGAYRVADERRARELVAEVAEGAAYAQDPASQLVALLALRLAPAAFPALDLCAAPGGKSALILRQGGVSDLCAADLSLRRAALVRRLLVRMGAAPVVVADAGEPPFACGTIGLALVDAPCSGTGTLRRHPELKWRLAESDIGGRAAVQRRILDGALPLVARGGVLLYATCSVEPEENEAHFQEPPVGWELLDLSVLAPPGAPVLATAARGVRLMPGGDADGFTIHALRRL